MKILVVGAGALGGYFGGRLMQAGCDITYLLRPRRINQLHESKGLQIKSPHGDMNFATIEHITSNEIKEPYDLIILSCKAYSLQGCIASIAPAVGEHTMIMPVLNGLDHINMLSERFGKDKIIGGLALISATLNEQGHILHLNKNHQLTFGELNGENTERIQKVKEIFEKAQFDSLYSDNIMQAMWNKWIMISTAVGATCLFRGAISDVIQAGGANHITALFNECVRVAEHCGFKPSDEEHEKLHSNLTNPDNRLMASMLNDMEKGGQIEAEAIIGKLIDRMPDEERQKLNMLNLVYTHLKTYEARKKRGALSA